MKPLNGWIVAATRALVANSRFAQCSHGIPPKSGWIGDLRGPHSPIFASRGRRNGEFATSVRSFNIHRLRVRLECVVVAPAYEGGRSPGVQAIVYVLHAL